jgi:hypothetical protein
MRRLNIFRVLFQIGRGYVKSICSIIRFGFVISLLAGVSIALIFPLWFLSTHFKEIYTISTITGLIVLCILYLVLKTRKIITQNGVNEILLKFGKICTFFMCIAILGIILLFYSIFFTLDQLEINGLLKESLFISLLVLSIIYIYTISVIREHGFLLPGIYLIIMCCAGAGLAYFILLLFMKELYIHFICSFVLYILCFGYLFYSRKSLLLKYKQRLNAEE